MSVKFRIGALRELYSQPLYRRLKNSPEQPGELFFDQPTVHIDKLMGKELEAAFIHPIDYALNSSDLIIYPTVGVTGSGFDATTRLYLRGKLRTISSMAVGNVSTTDVVLTRAVLTEKYDSTPVIVPAVGTIEEMLHKADCVLVASDEIHSVHWNGPFIDIIDEWTDITGLPFLHAFCVSRSESFNQELSELLKASQQAGRIELEVIAHSLADERRLSADDVYQFLSHFSYEFDEQANESLETFFQMAFFHGILGDVPEINIGQ